MLGRNLTEISATYQSFAATLDAGVDLRNVLTSFEKTTNEPLLARKLGARIAKGSSLHGAMRAERLPRLDIAMIRAGEESGSLPVVARQLGDYYHDRYMIERTLKYSLLKPSLLFSVSLLTSALPAYVLGRISLLGYLSRTAVPIAAMIAVYFFVFDLLWKSVRSPELDSKLDELLFRWKVSRDIMTAMAKERFFVAFLICVKAGCSLETMIAMFREVTNHPSLEGVTGGSFGEVAQKKGIAAALALSLDVFDHNQVEGVRVGELTGRLEQQLETIVKETRGDLAGRLERFAEWAPRVLYTLIGAFVFLNMFF